jgi:pimeloyl-ACP methyl ester carboxylesterase
MMQDKTIYYKDCVIYYKIIGKGKPAIFLHGFAEDGNVWQYQIDHLKDQYQLIIPDIPGSGQSAIANRQTGVDIDELAESIKAILDEEKIINCTMIGHSMGGYITLALAEKYPGLLNGFGLFHSSALADSDEKKQARLKSIDFIKANGSVAFIKSTTPGLFAASFTKNHSEAINSLVDNGKNFVEEALIQYYNAMKDRPDRSNVLLNFNAPVLFIIGENDKAIPLDISLKQCYLPKQSHIFILKDSAHMGMWEEKDRSNKIISDFLQLVNT